jgi:hypothetical protein
MGCDPPECQTIMFGSRELDDKSKTLLDYRINNDQTKLLLLTYLPLSVVTPGVAKGFHTKITKKSTIGDLKYEIQYGTNINRLDQLLYINGELQVDDKQNVVDLINTSDFTAYVADKQANNTEYHYRTILLVIELHNKQKIVIFMDRTQKVVKLKKYLEDNYGFFTASQILTFSRGTLSNDKQLQTYSLINDSNLLLKVNSSSIKIKVNDDVFKKCGLTINNTVKEVKEQVFELCQIPKHRQSLYSMFDHRPQYMKSDKCLLSQYSLINGCVVIVDILPPKIETLIVHLGTGKTLKANIDVGEPVSSIKSMIQNLEGIDIGCQILIKGNNVDQFDDRELIVDCIDITQPLLVKVLLSGPIDLDVTSINDRFNYDFTDINDNGQVFQRGGLPYERPCGCYRIALKVAGIYPPNDKWLGMTGTDSEEWGISYHGTGKHKARSIAEEGYRLSRGKRFLHGMGIYSTPELEIAKQYASEFVYEGKKYLLVIQNRVNPKYLQILDKQTTGVGTYYLSMNDQVTATDMSHSCIRPYAMCLFKYETRRV